MDGHDPDHEQDEAHEDAHEESEEERVAEAEHELRRRIALAQVRQYGDPVLRMRANEVDAFDEELRRIADRMIELMHDADGIGLAATQVGILKRFFVFHDDGEDRVLVNPQITVRAGEPEVDEEGCLSLGKVRVPVPRDPQVTIEGRDVAGEPVSYALEGLPARVVQHELDHLDGMLIIDRTDAEHRRGALSQLRPRLLLSR